MRRYSILGISLKDYTARESLRQMERFLGSGAMNTITYISAQTLEASAKEESVKALLEKTDLTICAESDILEAAGIASPLRIREIEERVVLQEFLRRIERVGDSIYLLGETQEDALLLKGTVEAFAEGVRFADCKGYDAFEWQPERLMNALNEAAPRVIFSRMSWPMDLELMHQGRKFLNAEIWFALPEKKLPEKAKRSIFHNIRKRIFQKKVNEYNEEEAER